MEPAFSSHNGHAAAPTTASGSRGFHAPIPIDEDPKTQLESSGSEAGAQSQSLPSPYERAGLRSTSSSSSLRRRHRPPVEAAADASVQRRRVHVAYRHSDLEPVRSQQQQQDASSEGTGGASSSSSSSSPIAARGVEDASLEEGEGGRLSGEDVHQRGGGGGGRGTAARHRVLSLDSTGFRMPAAIENGMGSGWNEGPPGAFPSCPSSPRVFQIGMAMDTGFFKVRSLVFVSRIRSGTDSELVLDVVTAFNGVANASTAVLTFISRQQ